jgi:peptidoglycan hydrolase CwlO-like protein
MAVRGGQTMTSEERFERIEQKVEFIVNQQAQFSVDLQSLRETQAVMQAQIGQLTDQMTVTLALVGQLAEAQAKTEATLQKLEEKGAETEERLNIFINFVERYLSEHGNNRKSEQP